MTNNGSGSGSPTIVITASSSFDSQSQRSHGSGSKQSVGAISPQASRDEEDEYDHQQGGGDEESLTEVIEVIQEEGSSSSNADDALSAGGGCGAEKNGGAGRNPPEAGDQEGGGAPQPSQDEQQQQPSSSSWSDRLVMTTADNSTSLLRTSLNLTTDRANAANRSSLRCAALIVQVAALYEQLGAALQRAAGNAAAGSSSSNERLQQLMQPLQSSVSSWGLGACGVGRAFEAAAKPCKGLLATQEQAAQSMLQSCLKARNAAEQHQQRTQIVRLKYRRLCNTGTSTGSMPNANANNSGSSSAMFTADETKSDPQDRPSSPPAIPPPNFGSAQLQPATSTSSSTATASSSKSKQRAVDSAKEHYRKLWMLETAKFSEAACLTKFAIESLQQIETERRVVLLNCLVDVRVRLSRAYADMRIASPPAAANESGDGDAAAAEASIDNHMPAIEGKQPQQQRPAKNNLVKQFLKTTSSSDDAEADNAGLMDAETLGLPPDVGQLRDDVRKCLRESNRRLAAVRTLAAMLEAVASAQAKFGVALKHLLTGVANICSDQSYESPRVVREYESLLALLEQESKRALSVASALRTLRSDRCDKIVLYSDAAAGGNYGNPGKLGGVGGSSASAAETVDDGYWKHLCDAARAQSRAEMRYRQTTAQTAKVRERVRSVESVNKDAAAAGLGGAGTAMASPSAAAPPPPNDSPMPQKVNKHVVNISKMFSILPDGGEQAMKMLAPGARASLAKHSLHDADSRENKNRQLLDQAVEASSRALEHYKSHATTLVTKYRQDEVSEWDNIRRAIDSFLEQLQSIQKGLKAEETEKLNYANPSKSVGATTASANVDDCAYLEEWSSKAAEQILASKLEIEEACDLEFVIPPDVDAAEESHHTLSERFETSMKSSMDEDDLNGDDDQSERSASVAADDCVASAGDNDGRDASEGNSLRVEDAVTPVRRHSKQNFTDDLDAISQTSSAGDDDLINNDGSGSHSHSHGSGRWLRSLQPGSGSSSPLALPKNDKALRTKLSFGLGTVKQTDADGSSAAAGAVVGTPVNRNKRPQQLNLLTEVFLSYFWPDPVDRATVPPVFGSFACSFRDNSHRLPFQYGRVFVTSSRIIFNSWTGKKLNLRWSDVLDLEPVKSSFMTHASSTAAVEDTIMVTFKSTTGQETYVLLGGFTNRENALQVLGKLRGEACAPIEDEEVVPASEGDAGTGPSGAPRSVAAVVPPDATMGKMEVVLTRHLKGVPIERFYEIAWSEGNGTNEKPLYGPWLSKHCFDVEVGDWEKKPAVGPWCGECYPMRREVKFKVQRKTHLYIGPPIANCTQTQYCRLEGNDKCVLEMTVEFEGIPYSDTFAVEVRWVARRDGLNDILIEVGVFVNFKKNTFLKSKIRSGTIEETAPVHKSLFETVKKACVAAGGEGVEEAEEVEEEKPTAAVSEPSEGGLVATMLKDISFDNYTIAACAAMVVFVFLWRWLFRGTSIEPPSAQFVEEIAHRMEGMESEIRALRATMDEILVLMKAQAEANRGVAGDL